MQTSGVRLRPLLSYALSKRGFLWTIGILSFPFYLFPKGGLQISTFILLAAALQSLRWNPTWLINPPIRGLRRISKPLVGFVLYATLVQVLWAVFLGEPGVLLFAAYYIFNLIIFVSVGLLTARSPDFSSLIIRSTIGSVAIQVALSLLGFEGPVDGSRSAVFFQNPNQLGYFSLMSASIMTVGVKRQMIGAGVFIAGILGCLWLAQLSLSKAAMVAIALLVIYGSLRSTRTILLSSIAMLGVLGLGIVDDRLPQIESRFESIGTQADDSLAGRGYERIWLHPEMNLLGGGEGAVWRWESSMRNKTEIHSSWGTILFSYGIPGVMLMAAFLWRLIPRLGLSSLIPFAAVVLYGITHMGLRFIPMWILFGLIAGISIRRDAAAMRYSELMDTRIQCLKH
jgi:hypothetical protein